MKTRSILFSIFAITLFALGFVVTLLFNSSPTKSATIVEFFAALFICVFGVIFFLLLIANFFRYQATPQWQSTINSSRWAALTAGYAVLGLILSVFRLLNLATALVLLAIFIVVDLLWRGRLHWRKN